MKAYALSRLCSLSVLPGRVYKLLYGLFMPSKKSNILRLRIPKSSLENMPDNTRSFFLQSGHLANELNILQKALIWSGPRDSDSEMERRAYVMQSMFFIKILSGKIFEGWELIQKGYHQSGVSRNYNDIISTEAKSALIEIKKYFNQKENTIHIIRRKFSFHYDTNALSKGWGDNYLEEESVMYLSPDRGNSLYYASEVIANRAMMKLTYPDDNGECIDRIIDECNTLQRNFLTFINGFMVAVADRYISDTKYVYERTSDLEALDDIRIPYFYSLPSDN